MRKGKPLRRSGDISDGTNLVPNAATLWLVINFRSGLKDAINAERGVRGISMKGLARISGIPYGTLRNYLEHDRDLPSTVIALIAESMGMKTHQLIIEAERRVELAREQEQS